MLLYRPGYRHPERTRSQAIWRRLKRSGQVSPRSMRSLSDLMVDVETPAGERYAIDDPRLISMLVRGHSRSGMS